MTRYADLADREPKTLRDWTAKWNGLAEVATVNGTTAERVAAFCERKGITLEALSALGARVATHRQRTCLAFAGWNRDRSAVVALKYRPLDGSSHESEAERPSSWLRPIVAGDVSSLDWLIAEGETDGARLYDLVGEHAAILVLPTGAPTFKRAWADLIPRGATVYLAHDADEDGDDGAVKAARLLGRTVRLRPPGGDWCEWRGTREEFVELVREAREAASPVWTIETWATFRDSASDEPRWLIRDLLPEGQLVFTAGPPKRGKTWVALGKALALASGKPLFGEYEIPEPVCVLYVALEGSRSALKARLGALARGMGIDPGEAIENLHMLYRPRKFDLAALESATWLHDAAVELDARYIVVDVLRAAARIQENDPAEFAKVRDALAPLLEEGRSVDLLHHFGKLNETQKLRSPGERMAGTGAMHGALDVGFHITRSENGARRLRVEIEARDFAEPDPLGVVIVGTGTGPHGGFRYGDTATFEIDPTAAEERNLIAELEELFADGKWRTLTEAARKKDGISANRDEVKAALEGATERFVQVEGPRVDRHVNATPWGTLAMLAGLAQESEQHEQDTLLDVPSDGLERVAPLKGRQREQHVPDASESDLAAEQDEHEVRQAAERAR